MNMNTVERVISLCKERKIPMYKLENDCGFSNGYIKGLKKGTLPDDRLGTVANYLNVSVDYLRTGQEPQFDYLYNDENAEFLIEITKRAKDKDFIDRIKKYMSLFEENKKTVDDMIDFMYEKSKKEEN